jgi:tetratricopeptide (TPR) repeat protein
LPFGNLAGQPWLGVITHKLGKTALEKGDYDQAVSHYKEALSIYWDWGTERRIADGLEQLAAGLMYQEAEKAAQLLGAAEVLRQSCGTPLFPFQIADYERTLKLLRDQLDEAAFVTHWIQGRAMNVKQAVQYALT